MSNAPAETTRLSHQLRVLKRGAWLVLLTAALVTAVAVALSARQESLYKASADVFLGSETPTSDLTSGVTSANPERVLSTQSRLAQLPAVAVRTLELAGIPGRGDLVTDSSVAASGQADILTFSVTAPGAELATRVATAYAKSYTEYRRKIDTNALVTARKRIERQLKNLLASGVSRTSRLYSALEQRRGEISTAEALRGSKALLVRSASGAVKVQPKPTRNAILGALLGLFLGVALVLLRDAVNTRLRTAEEVHDRLDIPLLARVPEVGGRRHRHGSLPMFTDPQTGVAEAFRILATNIDFANVDVGARTMMITSASRDEGKSTVLTNLAGAFARRGRHVLLADLDLRRPSVASLLGIDQRPGVTDVALGRVALEEALVQVPLGEGAGAYDGASTNGNGHGPAHAAGTLEVLPAGTIPKDAGELVTSPQIARLLDQLAGRADLVLLDAPPILHLGDTLALSPKVDALLVVARLSQGRRPLVDELSRVLEGAPVLKLGLIVTGVGPGENYGYGEGYEYGAATGRTAFSGRGPASVLPGRGREPSR
jgi:Mrp family chromosome partitioning ATPase